MERILSLVLVLESVFTVLAGTIMCLHELLRRQFFGPPPFVLELLVRKPDAPARVPVDPVEDLQHFLLFVAFREDFGRVCQRPYGNRSDTSRAQLEFVRVYLSTTHTGL